MKAWLCGLLALLWGAGCHVQHGAGESSFVRVITPHFTLYTDRSKGSAEEQARQLEWMLQGLMETGWEYHGKLPLRLNVVLLKDPADFERYTKPGYGGYFVDNVLMEPWAVLPAPRDELDLHDLVHELSHHLAYLALQNQPAWFAEGLATYYETASLDSYGQFVLGAPSVPRHRVLSDQGIMSARELFEAKPAPSARLYASAWLLVHYLMTEHGDAFVRYQEELGRGKSHDLAWLSAFPGLSDEVLDGQLRDYFAQGEYQVLDAQLTLVPVPLTVKQLSLADEEALLAELWFTCIRCSDQQRMDKARPHLDRALALDPKQIEARLLWGGIYLAEVERGLYFRQLTQDAPDDYRGFIGLSLASAGEAAGPPSERALALAPSQPASWLASARYHGLRGDRGAALAAVERALRLRPTDIEVLVTYADLLAQSGACDELDRTAWRVYEFDARRVSERQRQLLQQRQRACRGVGVAE